MAWPVDGYRRFNRAADISPKLIVLTTKINNVVVDIATSDPLKMVET